MPHSVVSWKKFCLPTSNFTENRKCYHFMVAMSKTDNTSPTSPCKVAGPMWSYPSMLTWQLSSHLHCLLSTVLGFQQTSSKLKSLTRASNHKTPASHWSTEYFTCLFITAGCSTSDSHQDICLVSPSPGSYP